LVVALAASQEARAEQAAKDLDSGYLLALESQCWWALVWG